jgi:rhodanese-related sulfurtransferase
MKYLNVWVAVLLMTASILVSASEGEEEASGASSEVQIPLYKGKEYLHVIHQGRSIRVQRVQDREYELTGYFAKTSRQCPPFCLRSMEVDAGVEAVGEVEVLKFMENQLREGTGMLIDARTPSWHGKGTIPGSVNMPFTRLSKDVNEPEMIEALLLFGAKQRKNKGGMSRTLEEWGLIDGKYKTDNWDFSTAKELILWCNGPACGQSPRAIKGLLKAGYPADKMHYYRGGMQVWQLFGLTTVIPGA